MSQIPTSDRFEVTVLASEIADLKESAPISAAGRVMLWRRMGGIVFGHIQDRSGRVQVAFRKDALGEETFKAWAGGVKMGDFVGVVGERWTTQKGEPTILVSELTMLTKTVANLPDKWVGIVDTETRYRKRFLDLLTNEEARQRVMVRSKVISSLRRQLDEAGFLEVETPILQGAASGAAARPFVTHHHALGQDLYLRIAPETWLKRAVAGSFDRVYEIGKCFRNEGIDPSHLQEFTMLEYYAAYWNYRDSMEFIQKVVRKILVEVNGSTTVTRDGVDLDFGREWPEVDYCRAVLDATGIDLTEVSDLESLKGEIKAKRPDVDIAGAKSYAGLVDLLYKRAVRPSLIQPVFLIHHPTELVPLARRSDEDPRRLDMFQVVAGGWELVKAYSELVDPVDQRSRLLEQVALREAGDDETMMMEEDFIEAMEYGMPPMSGLGLGIDRLVAFITDAPSLRETVLFPTLRTGFPGASGTSDDEG